MNKSLPGWAKLQEVAATAGYDKGYFDAANVVAEVIGELLDAGQEELGQTIHELVWCRVAGEQKAAATAGFREQSRKAAAA